MEHDPIISDDSMAAMDRLAGQGRPRPNTYELDKLFMANAVSTSDIPRWVMTEAGFHRAVFVLLDRFDRCCGTRP